MRYLAHSGACWKNMREVPLPLCRIRPLSKAAHGRRVENRLDTAAHSTCRFRLLGPDRIKNLDDQARIDFRDGQFPQNRVSVGFECVLPLLPVLRVAPPGPVPFDEIKGAFTEFLPF
jgi:hypothetical protein